MCHVKLCGAVLCNAVKANMIIYRTIQNNRFNFLQLHYRHKFVLIFSFRILKNRITIISLFKARNSSNVLRSLAVPKAFRGFDELHYEHDHPGKGRKSTLARIFTSSNNGFVEIRDLFINLAGKTGI